MAKLGSPQTRKFSIGTAELRIGPLTKAMQLAQSNSIGLVDQVSIEVAQDSVDLLGGFPQQPVDTAIVTQNSTITATLREYSRKNIRVMLGEGVEVTEPTDVESLITNTVAEAGTSLTVSTGEGANFSVGDIVVFYKEGAPDTVTVDRITGITTDTLTIENGAVAAVDGTADTVKIFKARQIPIGNLQEVNYFAVQMIQQERTTGRPIGFHFWKSAIAAGMTLGTNATDFASNDLQLKMLQPSASEYASGADLEHLANIIPAHPTGIYYAGADA